MEPRINPFAPGAGVRPPAFSGREHVIEDVDIAYDRIRNGLHANSMILLGLRGVGKTVLLNRLHQDAKAKGFQTVKFEVPDGSGGHLVKQLVPNLNAVLRRLDRMQAAGALLDRAGASLRNFASAFSVSYEGISFGATPATVTADSGDLEYDLPELLELVALAAQERGTCLGLFIDEFQYLSRSELSALTRSFHEIAQAGLPAILIAAGLPQIAALTGEAKSYAERLFLYPKIGALDPDSSQEVLREPAQKHGADFSATALARILKETQGYPYFLQTWGKFAWDEAEGPEISEADVENAYVDIITHLDQSFFRTRFDRCSDAEQHYLRGMAELGEGAHGTGEIAAILGTKSAAVANIRKNLINAGMIYAPQYGETAFTVPLFEDFMKRVIPGLEPYRPKKRTR
ncbi:MAG: ATP-binding protein [Rhodobacteraceae bacterium]|nr:ATP-binding protein [Paracoccaceae bacterium]